MHSTVMKESNFSDLTLLKRGKVRDVYEVEDKLLIVATDRMSAFDVVMDDPIPDKGRILTGISLFWFKKLEDIIANHLITSEPSEYPEICRRYAPELEGRSMLVQKAEPLQVECIVRGYLSGSGWEGLPLHRKSMRHSSGRRIAGIPDPSRTYLYPFHKGCRRHA